MTKLKMLGAAVVLASAMAGPASAQDVIYAGGYCANANCRIKGPANLRAGNYYRRRMAYPANRYAGANAYWNNGWRDDRSRTDDRDRSPGFGAVDLAVGVVDGAIGAAGALVTAPFRAIDAYNNSDPDDGWTPSRAVPNGFACNPGTWYLREDGVWRLCR
jgi:hypothetical protein